MAVRVDDVMRRGGRQISGEYQHTSTEPADHREAFRATSADVASPVVIEADVAVAGGGTAGVFAAIGAAELGARVVIIERDARLGGIGIRAGIHRYYMGSKGGRQDDVDKSARRHAATLGGRVRGYHPEGKWLAVQEKISDLSIEVIADAVVAEVLTDGRRVIGLVAEDESRTITVRAKITIDATGGGDVAALAGADFTLGRDWDGAQHTYSFVPRVLDAEGLSYRNFDVGWVDSTSVHDVSRAYRDGRRYLWRDGETPTSDHYVGAGPQLGVREGRLIKGEHRLTRDELLLDTAFPDTVMRCLSHSDTHAFDYANENDESQIWLGICGLRPFRFGGRVPYRSLIPAEMDGLLIGCRALSQTRDSSMGLRMQRDMQKVGEVAGVAAALSCELGVQPRHLDVPLLQEHLIQRGLLTTAELSRPPVPWVQVPGSTDPDGRPTIPTLLEHLGGEHEGASLWWLMRYGDDAAPPLRHVLANSTGERKRGAAYALGLIGDRTADDHLVELVRSRSEDTSGSRVDHRAEPRWIAALIVLRLLGSPAAIDEATTALTHERSTSNLLHLLRYLASVTTSFTSEQRDRLVDVAQGLLSRPGVGDDFVVQGSGVPHTIGDTTSHRWGLQLLTAYLLGLLGVDVPAVWRRYEGDPRRYMRAYAALLQDRLARKVGPLDMESRCT